MLNKAAKKLPAGKKTGRARVYSCR